MKLVPPLLILALGIMVVAVFIAGVGLLAARRIVSSIFPEQAPAQEVARAGRDKIPQRSRNARRAMAQAVGRLSLDEQGFARRGESRTDVCYQEAEDSGRLITGYDKICVRRHVVFFSTRRDIADADAVLKAQLGPTWRAEPISPEAPCGFITERSPPGTGKPRLNFRVRPVPASGPTPPCAPLIGQGVALDLFGQTDVSWRERKGFDEARLTAELRSEGVPTVLAVEIEVTYFAQTLRG